MDQHALAILGRTDGWNLPNVKRIQESGKWQTGKFEAIWSKLLYYLVFESQKFGGEVANQFWKQLRECDIKLKDNIENLKELPFRSTQSTYEVLFQGLNPGTVDFSPVFCMAAEFFTHLGVAFMNPGGRKFGGDSAYSVSEAIEEETEKLLEVVKQEGSRKQEALKALSFRRDGELCLLTNRQFMPFDKYGIFPISAHIIPNAVHAKPDTLKCIATFAGGAVANVVVQHLNSTIGNVMNMQLDAHTAYDKLIWGIEAKEEGGEVRYFFRMILSSPDQPGPGFITLKDGQEISFGQGMEGKGKGRLGQGPIPVLCNLQLAVARVLKMSGAADIILEWKDQADDDGLLSHRFIPPEEFCDLVDAKLLLSGRALVA